MVEREGPGSTLNENQQGKTKPPPRGATETNTARQPAKRANETAANAEQPKPKGDTKDQTATYPKP